MDRSHEATLTTTCAIQRRRCIATLGLALIVCCSIPGSETMGGVTQRWSASTGSEFARGELDGTALDPQGRIALAPQVETVWGPEAGIVWDLTVVDDNTAFVGLSNPGRVLQVAPGDSDLWYEGNEETLITTVDTDGFGGVYAGVSPSGKVLHLRRQGVVDQELETGATFVWALTAASDGSLLIGTGNPGMLQRWSADGTHETILETGEDPVRCIATLPDGGVVIGTGGQGRIIHLDAKDKPYVLFDADEKEVVALVTDADGTTFALTAGSAKQVRPSPTQAARTSDNSVRVVARAPDSEETPSQPSAQRERDTPPPSRRPSATLTSGKGGTLYRIAAEGGGEPLWKTSSEMPFDLSWSADDWLLVSTGDSGRLHVIDPAGKRSQVTRIPSNQASAMDIGTSGPVWVAGTGDARVAIVDFAARAKGDYVSPAIDAQTLADWGELSWVADVPGGAELRMSIRVGNTAEPDGMWSRWFSLPNRPSGATTELPAARFAQVRAELLRRRESPKVSQLELLYRARNRRPTLSSVRVEEPGMVWELGPTPSSSRRGPRVAEDPIAREVARKLRPGSRSTPPIRKSFEHGARTFQWAANDPDGDRLQYNVEVQKDGTEVWFPLATEVTDPFLSWDGRSVPDGEYRVRLTVDDALDNPDGDHQLDQQVSERFVVDNTRPWLGEPSWRREGQSRVVEFVAGDEGSHVGTVEYSLDGEPWRLLDPLDGVADSGEERFRIDLGPSTGSPRALRVRVTDAIGNLSGVLWTAD